MLRVVGGREGGGGVDVSVGIVWSFILIVYLIFF